MPLKGLNYFVTVRRGHVVRHKRLHAQLPDADLLLIGQCVTRRYDENQFLLIDDRRAQLRVLRVVSQNPQFRAVPQHIVGDATAERAIDGDANHGVQAAKIRQ